VGATGANGVTGAAGASGATGATGAAGTNGSNGATGATGVTGAAGSNGSNGATGSTGPMGPNFTSGGSGSNVAKGTVFTGDDVSSATETLVEHIMPSTQTFTKVYCWAPKPNGADVFTVRVNKANVAGTCTVASGTESVASATVSITINAGELFDVQVAQGGTTSVPVTWTLTQ